MKLCVFSKAGLSSALISAAFSMQLHAATASGWSSGTAVAASANCQVLNAQLAAGSVQPPNSSNIGVGGTFAPGDLITVNAGLAGATAGTFRIVADPAGVVTLAGPANAPGTLSYLVTGPLPAGAIGIGVRIDTVNGQALTIGGSCTDAPRNVPTANGYAVLFGALLLMLSGIVFGFARGTSHKKH
jgi:hypothetical protein